MAGVLNNLTLPSSPALRSFPGRTQRTVRSVSVRSEISQSTSSITPPPNFKAPEPKRFAVSQGKALDILGASLALFFRLGTGVFVNGYSVSFVPKDEFPPGKYALEVGGTIRQPLNTNKHL